MIEAAKVMKQEFITGNHNLLENKPRKKKEVSPTAIFDLARESWQAKATVVEPDQHRRLEIKFQGVFRL